MKKSALLKVLNPILGILMLNQIVTAMINKYVGMPYEAYEISHGFMGMVLTVVVIVHLTLNWGWVVTSYFKKKS